ncbi:MAG: leucine-rich repeat domain-containing protein [Prevotellaceae bacterium]|jgi:hypothetical protein|nr:leucine-rich repeat domain-containing protein [Prevotellaceae bacterium]
MDINITNVNSIKELSRKLETVFSEVKVQRNVLLVKKGNKTYRIKHKRDNLFSVELAIPVVYNALGGASGLLCFLTGFTGFIFIFLAIVVLLLIITGVYQLANKKDLEVFVEKLQDDGYSPESNSHIDKKEKRTTEQVAEANAAASVKTENKVSEKIGQLEWSVDNGKLTICGQGQMPSYNDYTDYPWCALKTETRQIVIEQGVTSIGERAFQGFFNVTEIVIPESVTTIERLAFGYCKALEEIVLPDTITSLGKRAFAHCYSLAALIIPESVNFIGDDLLDGCANLEYLLVQWETPLEVDDSFIISLPNSATLLAPKDGMENYREDNKWRWILSKVAYEKTDLHNLNMLNPYQICRVLHGMEIKRMRDN